MRSYQQGRRDALQHKPVKESFVCGPFWLNYLKGYWQGVMEITAEHEDVKAEGATLKDPKEVKTVYAWAYTLGWNRAVVGESKMALLLSRHMRRAYRMGYRHGAAEGDVAIETPDTDTPEGYPVQIVLHVDSASFRQHADEQDGGVDEVAKYLKTAVLAAIRDMDLSFPAMAILHGDGCSTSMELRDRYADLPGEGTSI